MDSILSNFSEYLIRIGFLTNSNIEDFRKILFGQNYTVDYSTLTTSSEKHFDSDLIKNKISNCILEFLNLLSNNKKKNLGLSLFTKFYEINYEKEIESVKILFEKYKILKLKTYFEKWKNLTFEINKIFKSNKNSNSNILIRKKSKKNIIEKNLTLSSKEKEDLKECTFKPKINNSIPYINNSQITTSSKSKEINKQIINKLYNDNKRRIDKRKIEIELKNKKELKENTFKPFLISKTSKNIIENFNDRLKNFDSQKNLNLERLRENYENKNKYTFSPNITLSQQKVSRSFSSEKLNIPIHERLFKVSEEQKRKKLLKEKEINLQIKNNANLSLNRNNDYYKNNSVDYKKIEELYNDYKKMKNKIIKKRNELDIEQGITFHPEIYTNRKYYDKINDDFNTREEDYLNKKIQNIQNYQNYINEQNISLFNKRKYSKKEKEEITNNIINRLYKEGVEKYKNKRNSIDVNEREYKDYCEKNSTLNENNYYNFQQDNFNF